MGFYGNSLAASGAAKTQFTFDRIYSNRYEMDFKCLNDGVYIGRYVLIDYGVDDEYSGVQVYEKDGILYSAPDCNAGTRLTYTTNETVANGEVRKGDIVWTMETIVEKDDVEKIQKVFYICDGYVPDTNPVYAHFVLVTVKLQGEGSYYANYQIDLAAYTSNNNGRGYDSTVWQKVYSEGKEYYINVAELNGVVPTFSITYDAPTTYPIAPHFDMSSTNTMYKIHMQPQWGFKVKHADASASQDSWLSTDDTVYKSDTEIEYIDESYYEAFLSIGNQPENANYPNFVDNAEGGVLHQYKYPGAIYYNKLGFDPRVRSYDAKTEDKITVLPTGCSGQMYNTHDANPLDSKSRPDTQELVMMLPSIGNAVSKLWDVLYGDEEMTGSLRNLDVDWDSTAGLRMISSAGADNYTYKPDVMRSAAGCINSIHDLMGMIVVSKDRSESEEDLLQRASLDKIYFIDGKYKYKDIVYNYKKLDDPSAVLGKDAVYRPITVKDYSEELPKYIQDKNDYIAQKTYEGGQLYKVTPSDPVVLEAKGFEPYKYYQRVNGNLILGNDITFADGYEYSEVSEVTQVTFPPETETWEEMDAPTYFYKSNHSNWYYKKTNNEGIATYYRALEGSPQQFEGSDGTMQNYPYYIITPTEGNTGYITDESGNLIPVIGLDIDNAKRINVIKYDPNVSYYTLTPNSSDLDDNYDILEEEQKELAYSYTKVNSLSEVSDTAVYYTLKETIKKPFYKESTYYRMEPNSIDNTFIDFRLAVEPVPIEGVSYYNITVEEPWNLTNFYEPGKYYYTRDGVTYAIDNRETITAGETYYKRDAVYVHPDSTNLNYPTGTEWNSFATEIPENVILSTREEGYGWKTLIGFGRTLNTIHGLILEINRVMQFGNTETRDETTVAGLMNKMKDIISKFAILIPNKPMVVNQYASMASADFVTNEWLTANIDGTPDAEKFNITHLYPHKKSDSTSTHNVNGNGDTIVLETLERDNTGHVIKVNQNTVTLPFGFKNIGTNGVANVVTQLELPNTPVTITADSTQATFNINSANKWMRIANTDGTTNNVAIGHALSPVAANANTEYGLKANETIATLDQDNTFEVPSFKFDQAGHIIEANTRTVAIPENFQTVKTTVSTDDSTDFTAGTAGSIVADNLTDEITLAEGNKWINIVADATNDKITFNHYVKKFVEAPATTDLDNSQTFTVQELTWDNAGHLTGSTKRTYTLNDGIKTLKIANTGNTLSTINAVAKDADLIAASQVDSITFDTGNRWISLVGDATGKKVSIHHTGAGQAVTTKGETADQTLLKFGDTFQVLEVGIDAAGHVNTLNSHSITIPKGSLNENLTATGSSVLTGLSMNANTGAITQTNANVGTLTLQGYTQGTDVGAVLNTDTINGAFAKLQNQIVAESNARINKIESLDYTDTANENQVVTKVSETDGIISVERKNITSLKLDGYNETTESTNIAATDTLGKALALLQNQITINENALKVLTEGVSPTEIDGVNDLLQWVKDHETTTVATILSDIADLQSRAMPSYEELDEDEIYLMKKTSNGVEWVKMAQWVGKEY